MVDTGDPIPLWFDDVDAEAHNLYPEHAAVGTFAADDAEPALC